MFPNFRLMLVAMLASIVAIGCGLGLFAALRVNHQPFTRLANENPPLQLVIDHTMPAPQPTPFAVRLDLGATPAGSADEPPQALATPPASASAPVSLAPAPLELAVTQTAKPAPETDSTAAPTPSEPAVTEASAPVPGAAAPSDDGKATAEPQSAMAATKTAALTPANDAASAPETGKNVKSAQQPVRRKVVRRVRLPRAAAVTPTADLSFTAAQPSYLQPTYLWTPQGQPAAPVRHRVAAHRIGAGQKRVVHPAVWQRVGAGASTQ